MSLSMRMLRCSMASRTPKCLELNTELGENGKVDRAIAFVGLAINLPSRILVHD